AGHVEVAGWEPWHAASDTHVFIPNRHKNAWIRLMESMRFSTGCIDYLLYNQLYSVTKNNGVFPYASTN
ncbi:hypothetical protein, partial [Acetivibrio sp. MSJd-27]|uniref:hypothetical protein n=1 Tax=Acetivibrio sp. MSJd-27 TaxID=2841523 RepID=UPI001C10763A